MIATPHVEADEQTAVETAITCAACGHPITVPGARTTRNGSHVHTRLNPHGYVWEFGCFSEARGCAVVGDATTEHTWFTGYAWRFAHCGSCTVHLGWRFDGEGGSFFGLILERLRGV